MYFINTASRAGSGAAFSALPAPRASRESSSVYSADSAIGVARAAPVAQQPSVATPLGLVAAVGAATYAAASGAASLQASRRSGRVVALRAFENELGVQDPVGFWDPAGFTADGNVENFQRRRQTELKHGRVSMLATMGYITPEITGKLPGYLSPSMGLKFADVPNGLAAISKVPAAGWAQIAAYGAFCELSQDQSPGTAAAAGDFGFKVLTSDDPAEKQKKLSAELANGRLAMMAIIGMFFQDGLTGSAWGDWALYTASPLRAGKVVEYIGGKARFVTDGATGSSPGGSSPGGFSPENQLGVQAPTGFWDPLGFCADITETEFKRLRSCEIKHGRISMLAAIGYIYPFYDRLPGFLSASRDVKYADIPNGVAAVSKVPGAGWVQILLFAALCEFGFPRGIEEWKKGEPGDYGYGFLGMFGPVTDPEKRRRSLNAELANGRLAMMAITGMVIQEGVAGTTGPEMWFGSS